jgi:glycosyltransferase involved in cell wall biosynthesis
VTPRITAAICTLDRPARLDAAVASVLAQEPPEGGFALVIVDNAPSGEVARDLASRHGGDSRVCVVHEPATGLARARNAALERCATELIAFIDDDAIARPGWLRGLVAAFDAEPAPAAAAGGPVDPRWDAPRPAWLADEALSYLSLLDLGPERRELTSREWFAGTNMAFHADALRAAGGFDPRLGRDAHGSLLSNEDTDALRRVRAGGGRAVYEPAAAVDHVIGAERLTQRWFRRRVAWQAASDLAAGTWHEGKTWPEVHRYLKTRRRWRRSIRNLGSEAPDAETFLLQLRAIYLLTGEALQGFPASR